MRGRRRRLEPHRRVLLDSAEPAGRRGLELLRPVPASGFQAHLVEIGDDDTVVLVRGHLHRVFASALGALFVEVAGTGAGLVPVVFAAAHQ